MQHFYRDNVKIYTFHSKSEDLSASVADTAGTSLPSVKKIEKKILILGRIYQREEGTGCTEKWIQKKKTVHRQEEFY
jgi:hypothetical protein